MLRGGISFFKEMKHVNILTEVSTFHGNLCSPYDYLKTWMDMGFEVRSLKKNGRLRDQLRLEKIRAMKAAVSLDFLLTRDSSAKGMQ